MERKLNTAFRFARAALRRLYPLVLAIGLAHAAPCHAAQPQTIYYNTGNSVPAEKTFDFRVLKLALSKSGKAYRLAPSPLGPATEPRVIEAMVSGQKLDVAWLGASADADDKLAPVLIPIDRGLLGYRLLLIDGARQAEFSRIRNLADLRALSMLQGKGWPDVAVLRHAGLKVRTGKYRDLFRMLMAGRADDFPRGANEIFGEQPSNLAGAPGLAIEKTLVLHYTFTSLFYVQKTNTILHDDLYRGFLRAIDDGSYEALFRSDPAIRVALTQANLKSRRLIEIDNPYLSPETRSIAPRFWFKP